MSRGCSLPKAVQEPARTRQQQSGRWQRRSQPCCSGCHGYLCASCQACPSQMQLCSSCWQCREGLREVSLSHLQHMPTCDLQRLPSSITRLRFRDEGAAGSLSLPPQLQQLTGLLHLHLVRCGFLPALLGSITQLRALHLRWCLLLPNKSEGTAAFLDVLPKLSCLEDLHLHSVNLDTHSIMPQRFFVLTASSHLTQLAVNSLQLAPIPKGAVQHMFGAGRQMPQLRACDLLVLGSWADVGRCCIDSADLELIDRCCPALRCLGINGTVQPGADLSGLLQLPDSCTALSVGGAAFTDAAVPTLVQLTQLKELTWGYFPQLTGTGLAQLTALDLDRLHVDSWASEMPLTRHVVKDSVSQQLAALCDQGLGLVLWHRQSDGCIDSCAG